MIDSTATPPADAAAMTRDQANAKGKEIHNMAYSALSSLVEHIDHHSTENLDLADLPHLLMAMLCMALIPAHYVSKSEADILANTVIRSLLNSLRENGFDVPAPAPIPKDHNVMTVLSSLSGDGKIEIVR